MLLLALSLVPILLFTLHFITDEETKGGLKAVLLNQYVRLDSISERERLTSTLRDLRRRMKRIRKWFAAAFAVVCISALSTNIPQYVMSERQPLETALLATIETNLREHFDLSFMVGTLLKPKGIFFGEADRSCKPVEGRQNFIDSKPDHLAKLKNAVLLLSDSKLRLLFVLSDTLTVLCSFACVLFAILISMRITVFLMSRLVGSRLWVLPAFVAALLIAFSVPFIMIQSVTYFAATIFIRNAGTVPDFFYIDQPTLVHLSGALSGLQLALGLSPESLFLLAMFKFQLGAAADSIVSAIYATISLALTGTRFQEFFADARRFNQFDFGISLVSAVRNWGIFTDLSFSCSYLIAAVTLILSHRRAAVQEYLLNQLEEIDSHPEGPFRALAKKTKGLLAALVPYFTSK